MLAYLEDHKELNKNHIDQDTEVGEELNKKVRVIDGLPEGG